MKHTEARVMFEMLAALVVFGIAGIVVVSTIAILKLTWAIVKFTLVAAAGVAVIAIVIAFFIPLAVIGLLVGIPIALIAAIA